MLTPRQLPNCVELDAATTLRRWKALEAWLTAPERIDDARVFFVQQDEADFWQHLGTAYNTSPSTTRGCWLANRFADLDDDEEFVEGIITDCALHDEETSMVFALDDASDAALFKLTWI